MSYHDHGIGQDIGQDIFQGIDWSRNWSRYCSSPRFRTTWHQLL